MTVSCFQEIILHQVCDYFGIGFGGETMALFDQLAFERNIIFYDSVMHHDHAAGAVTMRVRILFGRSSVRRPASVADAISSVEGLEANDLLEVAKLALGPTNL